MLLLFSCTNSRPAFLLVNLEAANDPYDRWWAKVMFLLGPDKFIAG
jgi:hypothetical protein